MRGKSLEVERK